MLQAAQDAEIESYQPADSFHGMRQGMVFKMGPAGLGYYQDAYSDPQSRVES